MVQHRHHDNTLMSKAEKTEKHIYDGGRANTTTVSAFQPHLSSQRQDLHQLKTESDVTWGDLNTS